MVKERTESLADDSPIDHQIKRKKKKKKIETQYPNPWIQQHPDFHLKKKKNQILPNFLTQPKFPNKAPNFFKMLCETKRRLPRNFHHSPYLRSDREKPNHKSPKSQHLHSYYRSQHRPFTTENPSHQPPQKHQNLQDQRNVFRESKRGWQRTHLCGD